MRLYKSQRLRKQSTFESFRSSSASAGCVSFVLRCMQLDECQGAPSIGIIASRKVGNSVVRNWCKRRIREIFREHQLFLNSKNGYLFIVRNSMYKRDFNKIKNDFLYCLSKIQQNQKHSIFQSNIL